MQDDSNREVSSMFGKFLKSIESGQTPVLPEQHRSQDFSKSERENRVSREAIYSTLYELDNFQVHYQPIFQVQSEHQPIGFEALARWKHPEVMSPDEFIPIIESNPHLRRQFGQNIAKMVVNDLQGMLGAGSSFNYVSMNVNFDDLNEPDFVLYLAQLTMGCPAIRQHLILEITETTKIQMTQEFSNNIKLLSRLGIRIALDDVGVGYANFSALGLPFLSVIKIDKHLVDGIELSASKLSALKKIVELCLLYDVVVVIEGIETLEQHHLVKNVICSKACVQGYYYSKPRPKEEWFATMNTNTHRD
ncbi:EAL domain-containing protein [Vibrio ostreicida]